MAGNKTYCIIGLLGIGLGLIATACAGKEEERALSCALDFANDYFNLRFEEAYKHCTAGSRPWIAFRASNITEKDLEDLIEVLNKQTSTYPFFYICANIRKHARTGK